MDEKMLQLAEKRLLHERKRPLKENEHWDELYQDELGEDTLDQESGEEDSEDEDGVLVNDSVPDEYTWEELQEEIEYSVEDDRSIAPVGDRAGFFGRNGFKWYSQPLVSKKTRTSAKNIVLHLPGPKGRAKNTTNLKEIWQLFLLTRF